MLGSAALLMFVALSAGGSTVEFQSGSEFRPDASMPRYFEGLRVEDGRVFFHGNWKPVPRFADYGMRWDGGDLIVEASAAWNGGTQIMRGRGAVKIDGSNLRLSYDVCRGVSPGAPVPILGRHMPVRWKITGLPHRQYRVFVQPNYVGLCPGVDPHPFHFHPPPLPPVSRHH